MASDGEEATLGSFIRSHRAVILDSWEQHVRQLPIANTLSRPALIDHVPELLERIADIADALADGKTLRLPKDLAEVHALERLEEGFDLSQVVTEFAILRDCVVGLWENTVTDVRPVAQLRAVNQAIDKAVTASVCRFSRARERTLAALDRIATEALESRDLDELLQRLLRVFVDTTPAVDTAAIMIADSDVLRTRAAFGLDEELSRGFSLPFGEGFAGAIAANRQPIALDAASIHTVKSETLRAKPLRALYGVPLVEGDQVIGVAHMGSCTAAEFSSQDRRLFSAMVTRATAAINQHMLREQAEKRASELAERELEFRMLADNMSQLAWIAAGDGSIYWYNRRWYDFTGTTPDEVRGWGWDRVHDPEHLPRVMEKFTAAIQAGDVWEDTFPLRGHDGRYRWFLSRARPVRDASGAVIRWFGTNTDVTEERFLDEATQALSTTLDIDATLDDVAELVVADLADGCIVDLVDARGALRRVAAAHVAPAAVPQLAERVARCIASAEAIVAPDLLVAPLRVRDRILGAVTFVYRDRTPGAAETSLATALELGRRAGIAIENAELFASAQQAAAAREEIVAIVSHDLRNPLATIELAASMAAEAGDLGTQATKYVDRIARAATRMRGLVQDLLDTATIEVGRLSVEKRLEHASQLLADIIDAHAEVAAAKGVRIERDDRTGGIAIECDRGRVLQAIGNLVSNAIKFSPDGGAVIVRGELGEAAVRISVIDRGPGIPVADQARIFQPYWTRKGGGGTGLGLYICKGIVEAHGGTIAVDSTVGQGTTFHVTLPLA